MQTRFKDAFYLLEEWARWAGLANEDSPNGYPSTDPVRALRGSTVSAAMITDHDAIIVDRLVATLIRRDCEMGETLKKYFQYHSSINKTAEKMRMNRHRVTTLVNSGVAWVDASLDFSGLDWAPIQKK